MTSETGRRRLPTGPAYVPDRGYAAAERATNLADAAIYAAPFAVAWELRRWAELIGSNGDLHPDDFSCFYSLNHLSDLMRRRAAELDKTATEEQKT